jgi:hypothetical protein
MLNSYDIIILTLIIIIIGIIIVINVKKSLNNKLSHVEIKIPEIQIPRQDIIVKVQKECSSDKFDVFVHSEDKTNLKQKQPNLKLTPVSVAVEAENKIEKFEEINSEENKIKDDSIPIKAQHINKYKDTYPSTFKFVKFPDQEKLLNYDNYSCEQKQEIINNANKRKTSPFPAYSSADPRAIKAFNFKEVKEILKNDQYSDDDEEYDSLAYFLKNRIFIPSSFDDPVTKGSNIGDYGSYGSLNDIGKIALGKSSFNYAKPKNYMFMGIELKDQK